MSYVCELHDKWYLKLEEVLVVGAGGGVHEGSGSGYDRGFLRRAGGVLRAVGGRGRNQGLRTCNQPAIRINSVLLTEKWDHKQIIVHEFHCKKK